jgi:hypothetical protein
VVGAGEHGGGHAAALGALQRWRTGDARGDGHDLGLATVDGVEQRLQVRARAGYQHGDGQSLAHGWRTIAVTNITERSAAIPFNEDRGRRAW